jgi:hypothetical protein
LALSFFDHSIGLKAVAMVGLVRNGAAGTRIAMMNS